MGAPRFNQMAGSNPIDGRFKRRRQHTCGNAHARWPPPRLVYPRASKRVQVRPHALCVKADPEANLGFQELRDEAAAERWPRRGFQRSRPGPPSSAQLPRWYIGWKRSNKLIESGSWVQSSGYAFKADGLLAELVIHPTHAAHTAPRHGRRARILLRSFGNHRFRCHQEASHRTRVL